MNEYRLEQLFDLQMGKTPSRNDISFWINGVHDWISIRDLSNSSKYISETNEKLSDIAIKKSGIKLIPKNTVVMSFKLSIGKAAITSQNMYSNEAIMSFHDKGSIDILPEYLYYLIKGMRWDEGTNKAVMGITLNKATLSKIKIKVHNIDDQIKIIGILDNLDKQINNKAKQLSKYDLLIKSRFVEMFMEKDYPRMKMNDVSRGKGEYGAGSASILFDNTRPRYVRITDINDDGTLNDDFVSSINHSDDNTYRLEYGDFMFARMGATVGKTYAYLEGNQIYAGYLIRYRLNTNLINPRYLFYYTKMKEYEEWVKSNQSGAAQPGINAKKYGFLEVPVAPIELQNQFATLVQQVDKLKFVVQKSLDETQKLFDSLMQEYFG